MFVWRRKSKFQWIANNLIDILLFDKQIEMWKISNIFIPDFHFFFQVVFPFHFHFNANEFLVIANAISHYEMESTLKKQQNLISVHNFFSATVNKVISHFTSLQLFDTFLDFFSLFPVLDKKSEMKRA